MFRFPRWKIASIIAMSVAAFLIIVPSFLSKEGFEKARQYLPRWLPFEQIVLGLDLQGGAHILLEVDQNDIVRTQVGNLRDDVRRILREENVRSLTGGIGAQARAVQFRIADANDRNRIMPKLRQLGAVGITALGNIGNPAIDLTVSDDGLFRMSVTDSGLIDKTRRSVDQAIEVIRRRVDALGTTEPNIQRQGNDRVLVQGEDLTDAQPGFDQRTAEPVVNFRFNIRGGQRFGEVTAASVGKPFAIVLDNKVISAPRILGPITGGSGQISGRFTVEQANNLAILLRAGALPAKMNIVEERTVGPGLGQDSIEAGKRAAYVAAGLVLVYMLTTYGVFGIFANVALAIHIAMIFASLILLQATLTLPGIAGIVLTIGMAVDSNVLIYERIREEARAGRTVISALDAGFTRAFATIIDSQSTMMVAAVILYFLGSGPVRGFAVSLGLGILTSIVTAVTMTRMMIALWYRWRRPATLPI